MFFRFLGPYHLSFPTWSITIALSGFFLSLLHPYRAQSLHLPCQGNIMQIFFVEFGKKLFFIKNDIFQIFLWGILASFDFANKVFTRKWSRDIFAKFLPPTITIIYCAQIFHSNCNIVYFGAARLDQAQFWVK